jgi:hypothetical protein
LPVTKRYQYKNEVLSSVPVRPKKFNRHSSSDENAHEAVCHHCDSSALPAEMLPGRLQQGATPITSSSSSSDEKIASDYEPESDGDDDNLDNNNSDSHVQPLNNMYHHAVDLVALGKERNNAPIYTRSLLLRVQKQQERLLYEAHLLKDCRTTDYLTWRNPDGHLTKVWEKMDSDEERTGPVEVKVDFAPRVALDRDFQREYGWQLFVAHRLRVYNQSITPDGTKKLHFDAPYSLVTRKKEESHEHKDAEQMQRYRDATMQSLAFWANSDIRSKVIKTIENIAVISSPIKKIVCFGMSVQEPDELYDSVFQHMPVFSIAKALAGRYEKNGLKQQKIEIILQEPDYKERDCILLNELHKAMGCTASSEIGFVEDPNGFLAIDSNTLVMAPYLPTQFPWLQIIADLFASGSGPAVIMGDNISVDLEKEVYTYQDRGSPAVAKFLSEQYAKFQRASDYREHAVSLPAGMTDYNPWGIDWIPGMDIYVRRQGTGTG